MHFVDGVLSSQVVVGSTVLAVGGLAMGLRRLDVERLPHAALLSAAFFLASLVQIPLGLSSVHLVFTGLAGIILGWVAFPALLVGLMLQTLFFGFGGITVLGVNTLIMAAPAVLCHYLLGRAIHPGSERAATFKGVAAGALAILFSALLSALALALSGKDFIGFAQFLLLAHLPVMAVEGALTGAAVRFLFKVKPALFHVPDRLAPRQGVS